MKPLTPGCFNPTPPIPYRLQYRRLVWISRLGPLISFATRFANSISLIRRRQRDRRFGAGVVTNHGAIHSRDSGCFRPHIDRRHVVGCRQPCPALLPRSPTLCQTGACRVRGVGVFLRGRPTNARPRPLPIRGILQRPTSRCWGLTGEAEPARGLVNTVLILGLPLASPPLDQRGGRCKMSTPLTGAPQPLLRTARVAPSRRPGQRQRPDVSAVQAESSFRTVNMLPARVHTHIRQT